MIPPVRQVHIFGGGTYSHVRCHLSLAAQAYGATARAIEMAIQASPLWSAVSTHVHLTRMACPSSDIVTVEDLERKARELACDSRVKAVFMSAAVCDFVGSVGTEASGKYGRRLVSSLNYSMHLKPAPKILPVFRQQSTEINGTHRVRKDIFLVGFKTTNGEDDESMYWKGVKLLKTTSCNLVLVNDVQRRVNMIVTPEESHYCLTTDRDKAIKELVEIAGYRSQLNFTQSMVVDGTPIPWNSPEVPDSFRQVVNYAVQKRAYKPFLGATVGHFAVKVGDDTFLTSIRKSDFNNLDKVGLVKVRTDGPDTVLAYGAKPSVGGQSQRMVFRDHPGYDCIFHAHVKMRDDRTHNIPTVSQREVECGSHQCGANTSAGLREFTIPSGTVKCVMLDNHGPNVVFSRNVNPKDVCDFLDANFDLSSKTGGFTS